MTSWAIGYDSRWKRDIGYGVPATCDYPGCGAAIDRGLSYVCGGEPHGGEHGCGLFFCSEHLCYVRRDGTPLCLRCHRKQKPFAATPDTPEWMQWKLRDDSWELWRRDHPELVRKMREALISIGFWKLSEDLLKIQLKRGNKYE